MARKTEELRLTQLEEFLGKVESCRGKFLASEKKKLGKHFLEIVMGLEGKLVTCKSSKESPVFEFHNEKLSRALFVTDTARDNLQEYCNDRVLLYLHPDKVDMLAVITNGKELRVFNASAKEKEEYTVLFAELLNDKAKAKKNWQAFLSKFGEGFSVTNKKTSSLYQIPKRPLPKNTIFCADNLAVMKQLPNESIDLIYIDPPFNTKAVRKTKAWDDQVQGIQYYDSHGKGIHSYIAFMKDRLEQMHRILKDTGSLFVHVDYRSVHYLKIELDKIFGIGNSDKGAKHLVNEIIWCYKDVGGGKNNDFYKRKHDTILWYRKGKKYKTNKISRGNLSQTTIDRFSSLFDSKGLITYKKLKDKRPREFQSRAKQGRVPKDLNRVFLSKSGGRQLEDWWTDINPVRKRRKKDDPEETYYYTTQKPSALLERIIETATNKDDVVADFFCGCGTAVSTAHKLGRCWIGVDASPKAGQVIRKRMIKDHNIDINITPLGKLTKDKVLRLDPFEFERYVIACMGGVANKQQRNDGGVDGYMADDGAPIEVKKSNRVGRPVIDKFYKHLKRKGRGFIIALSFADTAKEEAKRLLNEEGLDLTLVTLDMVIEQAS
ncbi:MAG: DNA methyltransferase [Pseudomonadota bacterium]|nr:DNA methyltransferase [Pseudomonadota bacterium]